MELKWNERFNNSSGDRGDDGQDGGEHLDHQGNFRLHGIGRTELSPLEV